MPQAIGYAVKDAQSRLEPMEVNRRSPAGNDIEIEILFCGICHSDVHQVKNKWNNTLYPCMPGHEIIGRVSATGPDAYAFKTGDIVGVGCMVDSCMECSACKAGLENYCENGFLGTYNSNQRTPAEEQHTYGGYSERIVVREEFVLRIPDNLDIAQAAPILCAGVTTYSPMKHWGVKQGTKMAIVGFGGLGNMAAKIAVALGANVTVITSSPEKVEDAKNLGVQEVIVSTDEAAMKRAQNSFAFILSTIPQPHDANTYLSLVARDGTYAVIGCLVPLKSALDISRMVIDRKSLGTSLIGGIRETQEVLDFCSKHNILPTTRKITVDEINQAFEAVDHGEPDYRYVIDMATIRGKAPEKVLAATAP